MKTQKLLITFIALLLISFQLMAGWVITSEKDEELDNIEIETTYIQDNIIKITTERDIAIFNFETNEIYLINPLSKSYWAGTLSDFKTNVIEGMKSKMENMLKKIPVEHHEMYKKMYQDKIDKIESDKINEGDDLEIKETSENLNILDYSSAKYQIWQDEILREDVWIAEKLDISDELNIEKFKNFFMSFSNITSDRSVENSPKFFELFEKGYPLKTIEYYENFKIITTVTNIEKKQIPASEFSPPPGFNKINIMDLWEN
ncbi:MAG: DUF4412 domain-containing protein [Bacteroidales bacterium]|nr:DUF4412 domain-containing protein [Bacteroidales bacterium]